VRHVDDDRDVGAQRVGGRRGAAERRLLLDVGDGHDVAGGAAGLGHQARRLEGDERAQAVVHRAREGAVVGQLDGLGGEHRHVPDAHQRAGLGPVLRADVDVQVLQLGHLLAVVRFEQVDRLLADRTDHDTVPGRELDALADEDLRVPAANPGEAQEAVVVDVRDDEADLVDVPDDGDRRAAAGARHARQRGAHDVDARLGEGLGVAAEHGRRGGLVAGRAGGGQQRAQDGRDRHDAAG
jgi:hypothetical protein